MDQQTDIDRLLCYSPFDSDLRVLAELALSRGITAVTCADEDEFLRFLDFDLPGALLLTQEALSDRVLAGVREHLARQPEWSELPIILLIEKNAGQGRIGRLLGREWSGSRQMFYQRPLGALELMSGIETAMLSRQRQRDVRDHIEMERELRRELNHRVKNILASVTSIFHLSARSAASVDELREGFGGRLSALSSVHAALFVADEGEVMEMRHLVDLILSPYGGTADTRLRVEGPELHLSRNATTIFGLVLHELATNALKYGAWSSEAGTVELSWHAEGGRFRFSWLERDGPPVAPTGRQGYGTRYVTSALRHLLEAPPSVVLREEGLEVTAEGDLGLVM